jgi:hypothetical protein
MVFTVIKQQNSIVGWLIDIVILAFAFTVIGYVVPSTYYRFTDHKFVSFNKTISLDRKVYRACEQGTTFVVGKSEVNSKISFDYQIKQIFKKDGIATYKVVRSLYVDKSSNGDPIYLAETNGEIAQTSTIYIPCDLKPGIYFIEGQLHYEVKGYMKSTKFTTDQFTIEEGEPRPDLLPATSSATLRKESEKE